MPTLRETTPIVLTDKFPPHVSVVTLEVGGRTCGVISRPAAADPARRQSIANALAEAGFDPLTIHEVLDGLHL